MTAADFERFARHDLLIKQLIERAGPFGRPAHHAPGSRHRLRARISGNFRPDRFLFRNELSIPRSRSPPSTSDSFTPKTIWPPTACPTGCKSSYVEFNVTNYLAQAKTELAKTNFEEIVEANFRRVGENYQDSKSPAEAKNKIREELIRDRALANAHAQANELATAVFNLEPARAENLATLAKQKGLAVHVTAPFTADAGPAGIRRA